MLVGTRRTASVLAVALLLLSGCQLRSVDKDEYVAQNEAVFRTLPLYPGARLESSYSGGLPADNGNPLHEAGPPYKAFVTTHRYQLRKSATQKAVLSFYHQRLEPEWRWYGPGQSPGYPTPSEAGFKRGEANIYLNVSNTYRSLHPLELIISIDHARYRK